MSINELEIILELKDRKEAYLKLVKLYINSDIEFKKYINNRWDFEKKWEYPDSCKLYSVESIESAIVYYLIDISLEYEREALVDLCAIYYSAERLGLNPKNFFKKYADIAPTKISDFLLNFANRKEEDKSLKAFGWSETFDKDNNVVLIPYWKKPLPN